jgi:hypothetical protein
VQLTAGHLSQARTTLRAALDDLLPEAEKMRTALGPSSASALPATVPRALLRGG